MCTLIAAGCSNSTARQRFAEASNYICYYGPDRVAEVCRYDVAILHVPAMTPANVRELKRRGVLTIGYLSVGEDVPLRVGNGNGPGGKASWYFDRDKDNQPDENTTWHSFYANASDPAWREDRIAEARRLIRDFGFDGLFLDTIECPDIYPESRQGMIRLVRELRSAFPNNVIVANRAFSLLKEPAITDSIDGIMFESFSSMFDFQTKSYGPLPPQDLDDTRNIAHEIVGRVIQRHPKFKVLALDYCKRDDAKLIQFDFDRAVTFGFLPCAAPIELNEVYDTSGIVGHPNEKFLVRLGTPEVLAIKLDQPRNGLEAGTIVMPSSCFPMYSVAPIIDGIKDRGKLHWSKRNWASREEEGVEQSLMIRPPQPMSGGGILRVTFAEGVPSRSFRLETSSTDQSAWDTAWRMSDNKSQTIDIPLPQGSISRLRIVQDPHGGSAARPNLMWIEQIELVR